MSAYLTDPRKIGTLAQAITERTNEHEEAAIIASVLATENLRSVAHRYCTDLNNAARSFLGISAWQYIRRCQFAAKDSANTPAAMSTAALLDVVGEYRYQSCECDDWPQTQAAQMLEVIKSEPVDQGEGDEEEFETVELVIFFRS